MQKSRPYKAGDDDTDNGADEEAGEDHGSPL